MCIDYTDLNRSCLKDSYPLLKIDKLLDNSIGYQFLSFMDTYSGYNQIHMLKLDGVNTSFMIKHANYQYNVMPFGINNVGVTYHRRMNMIFQ